MKCEWKGKNIIYLILFALLQMHSFLFGFASEFFFFFFLSTLFGLHFSHKYLVFLAWIFASNRSRQRMYLLLTVGNSVERQKESIRKSSAAKIIFHRECVSD